MMAQMLTKVRITQRMEETMKLKKKKRKRKMWATRSQHWNPGCLLRRWVPSKIWRRTPLSSTNALKKTEVTGESMKWCYFWIDELFYDHVNNEGGLVIKFDSFCVVDLIISSNRRRYFRILCRILSLENRPGSRKEGRGRRRRRLRESEFDMNVLLM